MNMLRRLNKRDGVPAEQGVPVRPPSAREIGAILALSYVARSRRLMRNPLGGLCATQFFTPALHPLFEAQQEWS